MTLSGAILPDHHEDYPGTICSDMESFLPVNITHPVNSFDITRNEDFINFICKAVGSGNLSLSWTINSEMIQSDYFGVVHDVMTVVRNCSISSNLTISVPALLNEGFTMETPLTVACNVTQWWRDFEIHHTVSEGKISLSLSRIQGIMLCQMHVCMLQC